MQKTLHNCLLILKNSHTDNEVKDEANRLLNQYNTAGGKELLINEIFILLEKEKAFFKDKNFTLTYHQQLALFVKYDNIKNNCNYYDDFTDNLLLLGENTMPAVLYREYEKYAMLIRDNVIKNNDIIEVVNLGSEYGFNIILQ